jgi:hypothetical protein
MWFAYLLALCGFVEAGWPAWQAIWWPYYLAKKVGAQGQGQVQVAGPWSKARRDR